MLRDQGLRVACGGGGDGGGLNEWCSHAGGGGDARGENVDHLFVLNVRRLSLITRYEGTHAHARACHNPLVTSLVPVSPCLDIVCRSAYVSSFLDLLLERTAITRFMLC